MIHSFTQFINEIFDKTYDFKKKANDKDKTTYNFMTTDKKNVKVVFSRGEYQFDFISKNRMTGWDLFFDVDSNVDLTGGGDALAIMATVVEIVKDFIQKDNPKLIVFNADKDDKSRVKLYSTMVKKLSSKIKFSYNIPNDSTSQYQDFILHKL